MSMANSENEINYKAICCEQIPEIFLDKLTAKNHFSKFGKINRFILRPSRLSCTVEYETEDEAEHAVLEAGEYNGKEFMVTFAEREVAHVQNTEEWVDPDVQSELEAMNPELSRAGMRARYQVGSAGVFRSPSPVESKLFAMPRKTRAPVSANTSPSNQVPKSTPAMVPKPTSVKSISEFPKVNASLRSELEKIMREPALNADQKYRVLDARDKLVRLFTVQETDITKAVSIKGFCPDMCPEKERWLRSWRGQAAYYECEKVILPLSSMSVSPHLAIKQYSRSSADQEVPLPHELRPEGVLGMTMQYLLKYIMDLCNDPSTSLETWFHFVWDRTRSIRKDITQQELCSLGTVNLVEQCARFHIHCAARLVAEGPRVFDKKINAENLTKCLQTLKYMYHDLRLKGVSCPHEAEFRSYIVLLNLRDSNFIWELKQLPEDVQRSPEIKKALKFYNALQNNNFVRFFNMVRSTETSYLSACILLGYFNKLRLRAMEAIIKAHNWRKNAVFLPLDYLARILGFEDENAARSFLTYHGLQCDEERVMLERLMLPDVEYSMKRAFKLVESKLTVSIGECVCGGPLDTTGTFENHVPHNSFDERGYLKPEAWSANDQLRGEAAALKKLEIEARAASMVKSDAGIFKVPNVLPASIRQPQTQQQQQQLPQPNVFANRQTQQHQQQLDKQQQEQQNQASNPVLNRFSNSATTTKRKEINEQQFQVFKSASIPQTQPTTTHIFSSSPAFTATGSIFSNATTTVTANQSNIFAKAANSSQGIFSAAAAEKSKEDAYATSLFAPVAKKAESEMFQDLAADAAHSVRLQLANDMTTHEGNEEQEFYYLTRQREREQLLQEQEEMKRHSEEEEKRLAEQEKRLQLQKLLKQQKEDEERLKAAKIHEIEETAGMISMELIDSVLTEQIYDVAYTELSRLRNLDAESLKHLNELLTQLINEDTREIANEELARAVYYKALIRRSFSHWRMYTRRKRTQRKVLADTPLWVCTETFEEQAEQMRHPSQEENLQMIKRYRHGEPCDFKKLFSNPVSGFTRQSINIIQLVAKFKMPNPQRYFIGSFKYFKFVFSLPSDYEELRGFESLCSKWLRKHISVPKSQNPDTVSFICAMEQNTAVCVRKITGISPVNEDKKPVKEECAHADAIICFMSCVDIKNTQRRLANVLRLTRSSRSIPVAFVVYNSQYSEWELNKELGVDGKWDKGKISDCAFFGCDENKRNFNFSANLRRALRFAVDKSKLYNKTEDELEVRNLLPWLETNIGEEMWLRWSWSYQKNAAFAKICNCPEHVIGIYNTAVERLVKIATEDLQHMPEYPAELREFIPELPTESDIPAGLQHFPSNWKNPSRQNELRKLIKKFMLPIIEKPPKLSEDLLEVQKWLLEYSSRCIENDDTLSTELTYQVITALVQQLNKEPLINMPLEERLSEVNYLPIIKIFAFSHCSNVLKNHVSCICPAEVVYKRHALVEYQEAPWWLNYKAIEDVVLDGMLLEVNHKARLEAEAEIEKQNREVAEAVARAEECQRSAEKLLSQKSQILKNKSVLKLERELDQSLYEYQVAKSSGLFDYSYIEKITDDIDDEIDGAVGGETTDYDESKKRRLNDYNDGNENNDDIDDDEFKSVISNSMNLLDRIHNRRAEMQHIENFY